MTSSLPIHIINLARSPERWERVSSALDAFTTPKLPYFRSEGVDHRDIPEHTVQSYLDHRRNRRLHPSYDLNRGNIGCRFAHARVWEKIAVSLDPRGAFVCEDDFDPAVGMGFDQVYLALHNFEFWRPTIVKLYGDWQPRLAAVRRRRLVGDFSVATPYHVPSSNACYLINRLAARALLKRYGDFFRPLDRHITHYWELGGIDVKCVYPYPVRLHKGSAHDEGSTWRQWKAAKDDYAPGWRERALTAWWGTYYEVGNAIHTPARILRG